MFKDAITAIEIVNNSRFIFDYSAFSVTKIKIKIVNAKIKY